MSIVGVELCNLTCRTWKNYISIRNTDIPKISKCKTMVMHRWYKIPIKKKANRCYPFVNVWFKLTPLLFLSKNYQISIQRKENGFRLPKAVTTAKYSLFYWARGYMNIEWIQEVSKTFWILHNENFFYAMASVLSIGVDYCSALSVHGVKRAFDDYHRCVLPY